MDRPAAPSVLSGLECCPHLNWGAHFCHFYESREDLTDTLVPFFAEGLQNREQCIWVTSVPLDVAGATAALSQVVPELDAYIDSGQLLIIDQADWYASGGKLDTPVLLKGWLDAEKRALDAGFSGVRATGNITFLHSREAQIEFSRYESQVSDTFAGRKLLALCSYRLDSTNGAAVLDAVRNHQFAIVRRDGDWEMVESGTLKAAKQQLHEANARLEAGVLERTAELRETMAALDAQRCTAEDALRRQLETQRQLEAELADARLLQEISAALVDDGVVQRLYERLIEVATLIMRSDFASMQQLHPDRDELVLLAHRGFTQQAARHWHVVRGCSKTICGAALQRRSRIVAPDVHASPFVDPHELKVFRSSGIRSVQTTPLVSRSGALLGMISTHWKDTYEPNARDFQLFDILVRQAADLIERTADAQALRTQTLQLVEADRRKDEFLATLAHELRNPLAPIQNGLAVFRSGKQDLMARVLPMMERQLSHMVRLVDDLLDVSRVSRGAIALKRDRIRLQSVIDSAFETSRPVIDAAGHQLNLAVRGREVWVHADLTRLAQVLSNVLNNAAKYTPAGGVIDVVVEAGAQDVEIRVADTGIGIPADMLHNIFDMFTQVEHAVDRSQGGLGLGLSLARHLVEMHQGSIDAHSDGIGMGATITIRLPLADAIGPTAAAGDVVEETWTAPQIKALIVDDNEDAAESLGLLLETLNCRTEIVTKSLEAQNTALAFNPDVIFLDLGMPNLNGYDLARLLRAQPALADASLVAVSGWGTDDDRAKSRSAGISHHLTKPVKPESIIQVLAGVSEKRHLPRERKR